MVTMARIRSIDWLATVFYPLAVILMEAFWVSPWLSWVGGLSFFTENRPVLHMASVIIVIVISLVITRIFIQQKMPMYAIQIIIIGSGFLTMLFVLGIEYTDGYTFLSGQWFSHTFEVLGDTFSHPGTVVVAIPAVIYLWWRGISIGQSTIDFRDIYRPFITGMIVLIVLIIIWQISQTANKAIGLGSEIGIDVIGFFFFGLLAIAITHLYHMRSSMPKEEARLTSVWRWVPVMLGVIGGMIVISFFIASSISPDFIDTLANAGKTVLEWVGKILGYIAIPIIYIVQGFVWVIKWIISLLTGGGQQEQGEIGQMLPPEFQSQQSAELPPIVGEIIKWLVLAVIIGLVIFFLAKAISRYRARRAQEEIDEVRESLGGWRNFRDDLSLFLKNLRNRFRRKPAAPAHVFDEDAAGPFDIREIFRHLQWESARSGIPRRGHETATEYAKHIEHMAPDSRLPLGDLTRMYERVRYGEEAAPAEKLDRANNLWQTLKGILKKLRWE